MIASWSLEGDYFEACSCEAICPCRRVNGAPGGRSTYGVCDFALGWSIRSGRADEVDLAGLEVVIAGSYDDDEPGSPWRVVVYLDERASREQAEALEAIFLGRAGGTTLANFSRYFGEVYAIRRAGIAIDHTPGSRRIAAGAWVEVRERHPVETGETVSCGVPGHDRLGTEIVADKLLVADEPLGFELAGRCGFASPFAYSSTA